MATNRSESIGPVNPSRMGGHVRAHAKALLGVAIASVIGIAASFVFQILSARYLAPADFGLLAAFFVIVNVAAVGSSSIQNSVTVHTAAALSDPSGTATARRRWPAEALLLGLVGGLIVAILSPWLAEALGTTAAVVLAAAATIPMSLVFADATGLMQGSGNVAGAVWWTTVSQIARVAFAVLAIVIGTGLGGMIGAVLAAIVVTLVGALWSTRKTPRPSQGLFTTAGISIIGLTVAFTWLTNSDVIFLRAGVPEALAGTYAAVAVLVKAGFLIPSTLSLYLLPRFVRNRDNPSLSRVGVYATLGLSVATSAAMILVFALFGEWLIALLYGPAYAAATDLLIPVALAYAPWIAAQGMLIKMTSLASKSATGVLLLAVLAQWITFTAVLPDITIMLTWFGGIGVVVLATFLMLDWLLTRTKVPRHT